MNNSLSAHVWKQLKKQSIIIALLAIVLVFSLATKSFFSVRNLVLIFSQVSIVGIIACAMTYVIITGNFDLTVGAVVTMGTLLSIDMHDKLGPVFSIVVPLIVGVVSGLICGYLVGYIKINSMIITMGMMLILQGGTLLYSGGQQAWVNKPDDTWFAFLGRDTFLGIPIPVYFMLLFVILFELILKRTVFGKKIMAVGGNACASRYSGINDKKIILICFLLTGLMAAFAGVILGSRLMTFQLGIGNGYEFDVMTGVILGGTSLLGGEGSVFKSFIGILIIGVLQNGFIMIGLPYYSQWIVECIIVLFIVWLDMQSKRREAVV